MQQNKKIKRLFSLVFIIIWAILYFYLTIWTFFLKTAQHKLAIKREKSEIKSCKTLFYLLLRSKQASMGLFSENLSAVFFSNIEVRLECIIINNNNSVKHTK